MAMGRDETFRSWMAAHLPALHRIARAFAGPADHPDLLQELMLAVWRAAPSYRGDAQPITFIWRVAHNRALTWKRSEQARDRGQAAAALDPTMAPPAGSDDDDVLLERLYAAIRQLPPLDRSLMLLSLEGAAYADMAALHGLSETNVGARLTRARQKILTLVEADDDGL
jgi:RNA polymerase sigma factor (sigma-70 family)